MSDPFERFVGDLGGRNVAGYFERAGEGGRPGRAWWFGGRDGPVELSRSTDVAAVGADVGRFLTRHPRGAVLGYLGFDAVGLFEPALRSYPAGDPFPLGELAFVPEVATEAVPRPRGRPIPRLPPGRPRSDSMPRRSYERGVRRLVRAIRDGEAFQVVLAHRRAWPRPDDLVEAARRLRRGERYSSFYYLRYHGRELFGASPESVAEVVGRRAFVDPIAGTLPRGPRRGRRPLAVDPKELAEHRMLVDLSRNDLGRVARTGSVHLAWTERLMRYAHLDHLVSRVAATLPAGVGPWDVLGSTFPAGTVSGAPKIRATELLRREEATWRGPYAGAVALLLPRDRAMFALTIRSAFAAGPRVYTAAGAGIVHRSTPSREYDETLAKLSAVESSLAGAAA